MSNTSQASKRITALLDDNSFVEIGALVTARATDFNLKPTDAPSDGVITGYGVINDNLVYVYSQDASVLNGTIGEMHAKKIANLYDGNEDGSTGYRSHRQRRSQIAGIHRRIGRSGCSV